MSISWANTHLYYTIIISRRICQWTASKANTIGILNPCNTQCFFPAIIMHCCFWFEWQTTVLQTHRGVHLSNRASPRGHRPRLQTYAEIWNRCWTSYRWVNTATASIGFVHELLRPHAFRSILIVRAFGTFFAWLIWQHADWNVFKYQFTWNF